MATEEKSSVEKKSSEGHGSGRDNRDSGDGENQGRGGGGGRGRRRYRRKFCRFTANPELAAQINYKNTDLLGRFITNRGKIMPRRMTGTSALYQRKLSRAIKQARAAGLLPYKVK